MRLTVTDLKYEVPTTPDKTYLEMTSNESGNALIGKTTRIFVDFSQG